MSLFNWLDNKMERMHWYDISLVKLTVFFTTLFLVTAWTGFRNVVMGFAWYWYLLIAVVLIIILLWKMFTP